MDAIKLTFCIFLLIFSGSCREEQKAPELGGDSTMENEAKISAREIKEELASRGYQTFDYVDESSGDTIIMQQYFMAFLKSGPVKSANKKQLDSLQALHLAHLGRMYKEGYADISGPFGDDGEIRGITIYNTPSLKMADSLANLDPMVKSGRLVIEIHPWWAAIGFPLR